MKEQKKLPVWAVYMIIIVSVVMFVSMMAYALGKMPVSDEIPLKPIREVSLLYDSNLNEATTCA